MVDSGWWWDCCWFAKPCCGSVRPLTKVSDTRNTAARKRVVLFFCWCGCVGLFSLLQFVRNRCIRLWLSCTRQRARNNEMTTKEHVLARALVIGLGIVWCFMFSVICSVVRLLVFAGSSALLKEMHPPSRSNRPSQRLQRRLLTGTLLTGVPAMLSAWGPSNTAQNRGPLGRTGKQTHIHRQSPLPAHAVYFSTNAA